MAGLYSYLNLESTKTYLLADDDNKALYSYLNLESTKTAILEASSLLSCTVT